MTDELAAVELNACPFCGGEVKLYREPYCGGQHAGIAPLGLLCTGCRTTHFLGAEMSQVRLKKVWNTRPIEDALRAENERLKAENASLKEANEIDLGEKAPLIFENAELSARVSELTRLLGEAEEAIREAPIETDGSGCYKGRASEWFDRSIVQRALQPGEGGK